MKHLGVFRTSAARSVSLRKDVAKASSSETASNAHVAHAGRTSAFPARRETGLRCGKASARLHSCAPYTFLSGRPQPISVCGPSYDNFSALDKLPSTPHCQRSSSSGKVGARVDERARAQAYPYGAGARGICVRRFGYSSLARNSTALLKECSGCLMQCCSSNPSMPSVAVVPRISTVLLVSLFTAVR